MVSEAAADRGQVARADLLRRLFSAWSAGDDAGFLRTAGLLIDDERRKRHALLAGQLEAALRDPRRPGSGVMSLRPLPKGRDERPLLTLGAPARTFDELVLRPAAERALRDLAGENQRREVLRAHGLRPRQRLLVVGPAGTGKSASAHAIASELSLPVATASLAGLTSSFLGETARNIDAVVSWAAATPCVLLLDEFDALATERSTPGDHGELRRVVATVLQLLEQDLGESVVVATSNHPQLLDSAVWRRFDEVIAMETLDKAAVGRLVALKLRALPSKVLTAAWAERLAGASPADVELACEDAVRMAVLEGAAAVGDRHLEAALGRVEARRRAMAATGRAAARSAPAKARRAPGDPGRA